MTSPALLQSADYNAFVDTLKSKGFRGDATVAASDRVVLATDNSIYQLLPDAVAWPMDENDLVLIARLLDEPRFHGIVLRPRGGGTGTNGQSLGNGLVVDCSRHMTGILEINAEQGWVRVEPGVIKDQLNAALKPLGLFFAPELSTSSRATLGGMISTDACGQGSCVYGKTSNHVINLRAVLVGGEILETRRAPLDPTISGRAGEILACLDDISASQAELIEARFPKLNRSLTGYDLAHIREGDTIDPAAVLCGSEGTLALIAEARLNVLPIPTAASLILIFYPDFQSALRDAREMAVLGATSVETIDSRVLGLAREEPTFSAVAHLFPQAGAQGVNIVEFTDDDPATLAERIAALVTQLAGLPARLAMTVANGREVELVWGLRKAAVGLLGRAIGDKRPIPFVEDCAVPPENLEPFIGGFRAILDREGLAYGMFGHVDAGVLHVRPAIDLTDPAQEPLIRRVTEAVVALARSHGGLLWGEHGKGVRSEFVPEVFGPLYPSLQRIKAAFDPRNQMNPGKIATPDNGPLWRIDEVALRGQNDRTVPADLRIEYASAFGCNGNGACFNRTLDDVMCPSYKATGDRRHSPKGRVGLVREWLRQGGPEGRADPQFEIEVKQAIDGCLSCGACTSQCPVRVDVPSIKSLFLNSFYRRHRRSLRDTALAHLEGLLPLAAKFRWGFNLMTEGPGAALMSAIGLTALPSMPKQVRGLRWLKQADIAGLDPKIDVVLVPDAFTQFFEPKVVADLDLVMTHLQKRLWLAPYRPSGKARKVLGRLAGFSRQAERQKDSLKAIAASGVPLMGLEPPVTLSYRTDYPDDTPAVALPQQLLAPLIAALPARTSQMAVRLLPHCSERVLGTGVTAEWHAIFDRFGISLHMPPTGCCGMAGMWGHETVNRAKSDEIFHHSWKAATVPGVDAILATGFSCRCQTRHVTGIELQHPVSLLRQLLQAPATVKG
ncbi:FAD-binding and (Fe-S)-binding domain-containing protein [Neorhizobium sp. DAR64872/K0K18]|uniref:FAD-binding and (Fe-S)-binding domain-containing protein n=1 Tax=Neorhizobium sp. DAR64872/K0K18 TaxID=3421958 RepID=UPI003D285AF1